MLNIPTTWATYISDVLGAIFVFGAFIQAGLFAILLLRIRSLSALERICVALGLGLGAITLQMLVYGMARMQFSLPSIMGPWIALWLMYAWSKRLEPSVWLTQIINSKRPQVTWFEVFTGIILWLTFGFVILRATIHPIFEWDGWAIWDLKARAFFYNQGLFPYSTDIYYQLSHLEYPLLQPLAATFLYMVLGKASDMALLIPASLYIALGGIFYSGIRRMGTSRFVSLALTLGYAWMPNTLFWSQQFYAETTLLFYVFASATYTIAFLRTPHRDWLWLTSLLAGFATQVKVEGIALILPTLAILLLKTLASNGPTRAAWFGSIAQYVFTTSAIYLPWFFYQRQITTFQGHLSGENITTVNENLHLLPEIIRTALQWAWQPTLMGAFALLFPLTCILVFLNIKQYWQADRLYLVLQIGTTLGTYSLFFLVFPQFLSIDNFGRYLLSFTNAVYWLFTWQLIEILKLSPAIVNRLQRLCIALIGSSSLIFMVLVDVWPDRFPLANFYARPLSTIRYTWDNFPIWLPQSQIERQQILDARIGGPAYGRLIDVAQALTPATENVAIYVQPDNQDSYLLQRSYYLLYPRKVFVLRTPTEVQPEKLRTLGVTTVIVYDRELQPGEVLGQTVYQEKTRYSMLRINALAEHLLSQPDFIKTSTQFGEGITLLGYQIIPKLLDSPRLITLFWQAEQTPARSFTSFVHVLAAGQLIAQHDSLPVLGQLPTQFWPPNLLVTDAHPLPAKAVSQPEAQICIGLYASDTGERLPILSSEAFGVENNTICFKSNE